MANTLGYTNQKAGLNFIGGGFIVIRFFLFIQDAEKQLMSQEG